MFPLTVVLKDDARFSRALYDDTEQQRLSRVIRKRYQKAIEDCTDSKCLAGAFRLTAEEKLLITGILKRIVKKTTNNPDTNAISKYSAINIASGNYIIETYLGGKQPRYPKIDGGKYRFDDSGYLRIVKEQVTRVLHKSAGTNFYYVLPMLVALKVLGINGRDEAARYEPLTEGVNSAAFARASKIKWSDYPYSAILVPGLGPQTAAVALDPGGARRCQLAAAAFNKGEAPFIIVSGGHVHPDRTIYSEGIEMRKYLITTLKIPASAVIAEPYARHTTTNIRNAARLIYTFGLPADKPVRIVTDVLQSTYILSMKGRFMEELGYLPYKEISRSGTSVISFLPDSSALQINPFDPLDP